MVKKLKSTIPTSEKKAKKKKSVVEATAKEKKKPKKAVTDPNVTYVFYVTDILFWQVVIMRYQLVKKTEKYAMVLDPTYKKVRLVLNDADGVVCDTFKHAQLVAKGRIKEKQAKLIEYQGKLDMSKEAIKMRAIKDVVPRKLKIGDPNKYEF